MREIILHKHLWLPVVISLFLLLLIFYKRKQIILKTNGSCFIALVFFFAIYFLIVGQALFVDIQLQSNLNQFDLNNDGFFSGNEITESQKAAMNEVISDAPRNFVFLTAFVFSFLLAVILYVVSVLTIKIKTRLAAKVG